MDLDRTPAPLRALLERAVELAQADDAAVGLVVNGSVAAGAADEFSDLDLVVVYGEDDADLAQRAQEFVGALGAVLVAFTGEHVGEPSLVIALVGDPVRHVDVKCVRAAEQGRRAEDGVIVWQRGTAVDDARRGTEPSWPAPDPQWIEDRFWVWLHYAAAKAGRGEILECVDALGVLRSAVLGPLIAQQRGVLPSGVRRVERFAPDLVPQLHATVARPEPRSCLDALLAAADLYAQVRPAGVARRERAEVAARAYVTELRRRF